MLQPLRSPTQSQAESSRTLCSPKVEESAHHNASSDRMPTEISYTGKKESTQTTIMVSLFTSVSSSTCSQFHLVWPSEWPYLLSVPWLLCFYLNHMMQTIANLTNCSTPMWDMWQLLYISTHRVLTRTSDVDPSLCVKSHSSWKVSNLVCELRTRWEWPDSLLMSRCGDTVANTEY